MILMVIMIWDFIDYLGKKINHMHLDVIGLPGAECLGEYPTSHSPTYNAIFIFKQYFYFLR